MKKFLFIAFMVLGITSIGLLPARALAATDVLTNGGTGSPCANHDAVTKPTVCGDDATGAKSNPINSVLSKVTAIVLYIVGVLAVIMVIISGIRMATSNGDSNAFNSARTGLIYSVLGLAVAVLARAVVLFIVSKL